jgi:hypothetical protein
MREKERGQWIFIRGIESIHSSLATACFLHVNEAPGYNCVFERAAAGPGAPLLPLCICCELLFFFLWPFSPASGSGRATTAAVAAAACADVREAEG